MTTGNTPALPLADTTLPADQQAQPLAITAIDDVTDVDALELQQAQAAAQAEQSQQGTNGAEPPAQAPALAQPAAATTDQTVQPKAAPIMVPKARLDEVLRERDQKAQEAAFYRGKAEAYKPQGGTPEQADPQQPPAEPTHEQKLAAIHSEQDTLADRFDAGEITMAEFKKQERELNNREQALREEQLIARVTPQQPAGDDLYLAQQTAGILTQHPWVAVFDQVGTKADWHVLEVQARENLAERGVEVRGAAGSLELRKEMAALADHYGPTLLTAKAQKAGIALPGQSPQPAAPQPQPKPALSQGAQDRQAKLQQQLDAPPNLNALTGATGPNDGAPTEAAIENMSDEQIAALPKTTRDRMLGITR